MGACTENSPVYIQQMSPFYYFFLLPNLNIFDRIILDRVNNTYQYPNYNKNYSVFAMLRLRTNSRNSSILIIEGIILMNISFTQRGLLNCQVENYAVMNILRQI